MKSSGLESSEREAGNEVSVIGGSSTTTRYINRTSYAVFSVLLN